MEVLLRYPTPPTRANLTLPEKLFWELPEWLVGFQDPFTLAVGPEYGLHISRGNKGMGKHGVNRAPQVSPPPQGNMLA